MERILLVQFKCRSSRESRRGYGEDWQRRKYQYDPKSLPPLLIKAFMADTVNSTRRNLPDSQHGTSALIGEASAKTLALACRRTLHAARRKRSHHALAKPPTTVDATATTRSSLQPAQTCIRAKTMQRIGTLHAGLQPQPPMSKPAIRERASPPSLSPFRGRHGRVLRMMVEAIARSPLFCFPTICSMFFFRWPNSSLR